MNTTYFLNLIAGNVMRTKTSPAIPTNYYIGLSTTNPATIVTEPSTSYGYARKQLTTSILSQPTNGVITNTVAIEFNESTGSWGTVGYYVIYDSATRGSGNLLMYGQLSASRTVEAATILTIKAGSLNISVTNPS